MYGVMGAKYSVHFHDGSKTHTDGSPFYDLRLFRNKKIKQAFVKQLVREGYVAR